MPLNALKKLIPGLSSKRKGDRMWHPPATLEAGPIRGTSFAMDRQGRGIAIWENGGRLWTQNAGPATKETVPSLPLGEGSAPHVAMNLDGRGVALWVRSEGRRRDLIGLAFDTDSRHSPTSRTIFDTQGRISHLQASVDRRGGAFVIWVHQAGNQWEILGTTFDLRAQAWEGTPARLSPPSDHPLEPRLAANRRGQAVVLWRIQTPGEEGLVASHYFPSLKAWSDRPMPVAPDAAGEHDVAISHAGDILAVWSRQPRGGRASLVASGFTNQSGWSAPVTLATGQSIQQLHFAMSGGGEALAAWLQGEGHAAPVLHSKAYRSAEWEENVTRLDTENGRITDLRVAMGPRGHAALLYLLQSPSGTVPVVRERTRDWSTPFLLGRASDRPLTHPHLALCPEGIAALWLEGQGTDIRVRMAQCR